MSNFLTKWLSKSLAESASGTAVLNPATWKAPGKGFLHVTGIVLHAGSAATDAYAYVRQERGLEPGFAVLRCADQQHWVTVLVPVAAVKSLEEAKKGMPIVKVFHCLVRVEGAVELVLSADQRAALDIDHKAPFLFVAETLALHTRKMGTIGQGLLLPFPRALADAVTEAALEERVRASEQDLLAERLAEQQDRAMQAGPAPPIPSRTSPSQAGRTEPTPPASPPPAASPTAETEGRSLHVAKEKGSGVIEGRPPITVDAHGLRLAEEWECIAPAEQLALQPFAGMAPSEAREVQDGRQGEKEKEAAWQLEDFAPAQPSTAVGDSGAAFQLEDIGPSQASSAPAYPPLSMASSQAESEESQRAEAAKREAGAFLAQRSRDSLEVVDAMEEEEEEELIPDSELSEHERQELLKTRLQSQAAAAESQEPPMLLQLSPIQQDDSPIFQQPAKPSPERQQLAPADASMELVNDIYAEVQSQPPAQEHGPLPAAKEAHPGPDQPAKAAAPEEVEDTSMESAFLGDASFEDASLDAADLSALMAVSRETQAPPGSLPGFSPNESSPSANVVASPAELGLRVRSRLALDPDVAVMEAALQQTRDEAARKQQALEAELAAVQREQRRQAEEHQRWRKEQAEETKRLLREHAASQERLRQQLAVRDEELAAQKAQLAKTSALLKEVHKRLRRQERPAERPPHHEEDTSALRVKRTLPPELLARKAKQARRARGQVPTEKSPRTAPPTAASKGAAAAAAARQSPLAAAAKPTVSVLSPVAFAREAATTSRAKAKSPARKRTTAAAAVRTKVRAASAAAVPTTATTKARTRPAPAATAATARAPAVAASLPVKRARVEPGAAASTAPPAKKAAGAPGAAARKSRLALFSQKYLVKK